jgi:hypothetical protein
MLHTVCQWIEYKSNTNTDIFKHWSTLTLSCGTFIEYTHLALIIIHARVGLPKIKLNINNLINDPIEVF